MPVYTLYLSSRLGSLNNFNLVENQQVIPIDMRSEEGCRKVWEIDWDSIFKGANYEFEKCRVRVHIVSRGMPYMTGFNNVTGYLAVNLLCNTNSNTTAYGVPLALTTMLNVPTTTSGTFVYMLQANHLGDLHGINICPQRGRGQIEVTATQADKIAPFNQVNGYFLDYQMVMSFEFYN